jgi:hypothetical protein
VTERSTNNPLTIFGAGLTTASAVAFIAYSVADAIGWIENPYAGLIGFALIPALFILGLLLIPLGAWRESRRRQRGHGPWTWPALDFGRPTTRRVAMAVTVLTFVNIAIVAVAGFGAVHYMESTKFCGQVCHEPMKPQFTAHQTGVHASIKCVACHVGPGASGAVKAKLAGTRQLFQVATGTVPRPIHAAGRVPAAAGTCVTCHRPGYTSGDTTRVIREYADDEANTETVTTLDMLTTKIHWHARPDVQVEYAVSDKDPNVVTYVKATQAGKAATEFFGPGNTTPASNLRRMDCLSCHSRPAHAFAATAERTVDNAIGAGLISRSLPFIRKESVAALKANYDSEAAAMAGISKHLTTFYSSGNRQPAADLAPAIAAVQRLYASNVFPEMKITWGTHIPQNSHVDAPGCFRCHTDEHKSPSGKVITQDCENCHKQR